LAATILEHHEHRVESLTLVPSDGGRFEVTVNGELMYSKLATGEHADTGALLDLLEERL
jgi:selenoprotein W-related protein